MARSSIVVVSLQGRLTSALDPGAIPDELKRVIRRETRIILDMQAVQAMDCSGIGLLVTLYPLVREMDGRLQLQNLRQRPRQMLEACGLLTILPTSESEEDALAVLIGPDRSELYLDRARLFLGTPSRRAFTELARGVRPL